MLRPINYPRHTPGQGAAMYTARNGARVLVANVMGRTFMDPLDDPVQALEAALGLKVDLATEAGLRPSVRARIAADAVDV